MIAARKIADAALDQAPEAPAQAALEALALEIEAAPRLLVYAAPDDAPRMEQALTEAAARAGYAGQILFKPEPGKARAAFQFDWGEGRAAYDPEAAAERIGAAVETAIAAEAGQLPPDSLSEG
jgi:flagellar assembly protein FliH